MTALIEKKTQDLRDLMLANKDKIARGIAGNLDPERAIGICCTEISKNPKLLECSPASIFKSLHEAMTYGWTVGGILGDCYLVPFKTDAVLIPGYRGLMRLAERAGKAMITPEIVYEDDEYEYRGKLAMPYHKPSQKDGRKQTKVKAVYCIASFPNGLTKTWHATRGDCIAHRDTYSQGWKRKPKPDNPWHEDNPAFAVMCKKTVIIEALRSGEIPLAVDDATLVRRADDAFDANIETDLVDLGETVASDPEAQLADTFRDSLDFSKCESVEQCNEKRNVYLGELASMSILRMDTMIDLEHVIDQLCQERHEEIRSKRGADIPRGDLGLKD